MGLISSFGNWLDRGDIINKRVNALEENVNSVTLKRFEMLETGLHNLHELCNKAMQDNLKLRDELNAIKAMAKIRGTENPRPDTQRFDGSQPWKR